MLSVDDVYKTTSALLAAADLKDEDGHPKKFTLRIESYELAEFTDRNTGAKQSKIVLKFFGKRKDGREIKLALNKKNAKVIQEMHGTKFDDWIGNEITIFPTKDFFGKDLVDCIRVEYQAPKPSNGKPKPALKAMVDERNPPQTNRIPSHISSGTLEDEMNDEVPF